MKKYRNIIIKTISLWVPVFLWAFVIFLFSSMPTSPVSQIRLADFMVKKSAHIVEYGVFTTLIYRALIASGIDKKKSGAFSVILAVFYAITDEFHQSFTPGRDPKVRDVFFDTIGSVSSIYVIWSLLPEAPKKLKTLAKKLQIL